MLNKGDYKDIPPFLIFKKTGNGRDVQFLGLAAPGNPKLSPDKDLVAFWRTIDDKRFQNYEAYFTILNTGNAPISREWINALINDHENNLALAPKTWQKFMAKGRNGIEPLQAPQTILIPPKYKQLQSDNEGMQCVNIIRKHYKLFPQGFEECAADLASKMDSNFINFRSFQDKC
mgnify:CR=1 FL=1